MALKSKDKIYFDTDCLSSFIMTNNTGLLIKLYGERCRVTSIVSMEFSKVKRIYKDLIQYQNTGLFKEEEIDLPSEEFKIFDLLRKGDENHPKIGDGEASVIALAYINDATMASNNLKDIAYYIEYYKLNNLTVADILYEAIEQKIIIKAEAEKIWQDMRRCGRKLPFDTYEEWLDKNKKTI